MSARVALSAESWGDGPRRALLIHGLSSNAAGWWRLGPELAEAGYTVTAPDLRGHGHSPKADGYTFAGYAGDVAAMGAGWDLVLGHSLGGAVAVVIAADQPGWAARLVLEDPALVIADPPAALVWLLEPFSGPMTPEAVATANPAWAAEDCRHKAAALRQCGPEVVSRTVADNDPWDLTAELAAVETPTLLMGADPERGALIDVDAAAALAANPAVTYTMVPGTGHSIHRDDFEAFAAALRAFD